MRDLPAEAKEITTVSRPRPYNRGDSWAALFQMQSQAIGEGLRECRAASESSTLFDSTEERLDRTEAQIEAIYKILTEITGYK